MNIRNIARGAAAVMALTASAGCHSPETEQFTTSMWVDCQKNPFQADAIRFTSLDSGAVELHDGTHQAEVVFDPYVNTARDEVGVPMGMVGRAKLMAGFPDKATNSYVDVKKVLSLVCEDTDPDEIQGQIGGM